MHNTYGSLSSLAEAVASVELDTSEFEGLEVEEDKVNWYRERFDRCMEDGVPMAINEYLKRLITDDVNNRTRAVILQLSMKYMN